jgi:hypothetical protein
MSRALVRLLIVSLTLFVATTGCHNHNKPYVLPHHRL